MIICKVKKHTDDSDDYPHTVKAPSKEVARMLINFLNTVLADPEPLEIDDDFSVEHNRLWISDTELECLISNADILGITLEIS